MEAASAALTHAYIHIYKYICIYHVMVESSCQSTHYYTLQHTAAPCNTFSSNYSCTTPIEAAAASSAAHGRGFVSAHVLQHATTRCNTL